ncbi:uncharacterized protein LOC126575150 [Anopheles aquasalis]|uniref:uncharacterized protein LOC126575150 n=1 Tax=Anopheles aquasalis TaxID=42839 RepID=UPI00215A5D76|nr:uncharacterized protein LOC126575150 [Anopheles aquasalis]XP_050091659.1 uncharacterized protein LOC126575150 [Anopheles aquasalis]
MDSTLHELRKEPSVAEVQRNGNGKQAVPTTATGWYENGSKHDSEVQRPRRLSFNGSDMELSDLKGAKNGGTSSSTPGTAIDTKHMLVLLALATTIAVSVRYLLPAVDATTMRALASQVLTALGSFWQDLTERASRLRPAMASWTMERVVPRAEQTAYVLYALGFGLLVSAFTWYVIYLDSSIPGVNPPTPFSASKNRYRGGARAAERRFHLGYITALVSGLVVFMIALLGE